LSGVPAGKVGAKQETPKTEQGKSAEESPGKLGKTDFARKTTRALPPHAAKDVSTYRARPVSGLARFDAPPSQEPNSQWHRWRARACLPLRGQQRLCLIPGLWKDAPLSRFTACRKNPEGDTSHESAQNTFFLLCPPFPVRGSMVCVSFLHDLFFLLAFFCCFSFEFSKNS
jgi:hypothetical protein